MIPTWLENRLICPDCRTPFSGYVCEACGRRFPTSSGVVELIPLGSAASAGHENHFDSVAHIYDEAIPQHIRDHYLNKRVHFLKTVVPPGTLLDVGCGTGLLIERLAAVGYAVVGVDISSAMLEVMQHRARIPAFCAQSIRLPFLDGTFDAVFCVAMLHHVSSKEAVRETIREMVRVAKSSSLIVIIDHNPLNPYWPLLMHRMPQDDGTERLIHKDEIISSLLASESQHVSMQRQGFIPEFLPQFILPLARRAERLLESLPLIRNLAAHNVVVARKL